MVDVGHIVTTHALTVGDLDLADFASSVALAASPYDEIANLTASLLVGPWGTPTKLTLGFEMGSRIEAMRPTDRSSYPPPPPPAEQGSC